MDKIIIFYWRRPTPPLFIGGAEICHNILAIELAKKKDIKVKFIGSLEDPNFPSIELYSSYLKKLKEDNEVKDLFINENEIKYKYKNIDCIAYSQKRLEEHFQNNIDFQGKKILFTSMENCNIFIEKAKKINIKTACWLHSCFENETICVKSNPDYILSISNFVKNYLTNKYNINSIVFYPPFNFDVKNNKNKSKKYITFINPVPEKGCDFFIKLAKKMNYMNFLVIEGWYKNENFLKEKPSNVLYLGSQSDMTNIWNKTKILLMLSIVDEAFGRVIVEANINGIPVIAKNKGGILEALNGSGYILNDNIENWENLIKSLNNDKEKYVEESNKCILSSKKFKRDFAEEFLKTIKF